VGLRKKVRWPRVENPDLGIGSTEECNNKMDFREIDCAVVEYVPVERKCTMAGCCARAEENFNSLKADNFSTK
jgi:hypothetical protein